MKKGILLVLVVLFLFSFTRCVHQHKIVYNIPDILPDSARKKLVEKLNKGKMYYKEYCAECHGIFTKGKENVPNFTNEQINNYSGRMKRRDPKIHGSVLKMSDEQMEEVITFLQLRKHDEKNSKKRIKKQY